MAHDEMIEAVAKAIRFMPTIWKGQPEVVAKAAIAAMERVAADKPEAIKAIAFADGYNKGFESAARIPGELQAENAKLKDDLIWLRAVTADFRDSLGYKPNKINRVVELTKENQRYRDALKISRDAWMILHNNNKLEEFHGIRPLVRVKEINEILQLNS